MKKMIFGILLVWVLFITGCSYQVKESDVIPPKSVTDLTVKVESGKIVISWKDPSDSDLLGVKIYNGEENKARQVSLNDGVLVGKGLQKYEVSGLKDGVIYSFKVSTVDNALNESTPLVTESIEFITTKTPGSGNPADVSVVLKYVCPTCGKEYSDSQSASECCDSISKITEETTETASKLLHYTQNIGRKNYSLAFKEDKVTPAGTKAENLAKTFDGFTVKGLVEDDQIVKIFYDRKKVSLKFKNKKEDSSLYKEVTGYFEETTAAEIGIPSLLGHEFLYWTLDENTEVEIDKTFPAEDKTFIAKWNETENFSVFYILEGGVNSENNRAKYYLLEDVTLAAPTKAGYTFDGWYEKSDYSGQKVAGWNNHSKTEAFVLYAKWNLDTYTISYSLGDGESMEEGPVEYNVENTVSLPVPEKEGYDFIGWYTDDDNNCFTSIDANIVGNVILKPKFTIKKFTVTFETYGGSEIAVQEVEYGKPVVKPDEIPELENHTFVKWVTTSKSNVEYDFETPVKSNVTVYAGYSFNIKISGESYGGNGHSMGFGTGYWANCVAPGRIVISATNDYAKGFQITVNKPDGTSEVYKGTSAALSFPMKGCSVSVYWESGAAEIKSITYQSYN